MKMKKKTGATNAAANQMYSYLLFKFTEIPRLDKVKQGAIIPIPIADLALTKLVSVPTNGSCP